jgi:peptidoglycan/LPS O-acetylase OafA/YrhL
MIRSIQAYRGFAALLVVAFHANVIAGKYFDQTFISQFFSFGHSGVPFFFVLSGFIIYFVHKGDIGRPDRASEYLVKRMIRIYPVYWVVTLAIVPIYFLGRSYGSDIDRDLPALFYSLLLIPQNHAPYLGVAWTLVHEIFFYLIFALTILHKTLGWSVILAWMAATIAAVLAQNFGLAALAFPLTFILSVYNSLFGLGILAVSLNRTSVGWLRHNKFPAFIVGNLLFLVAGCIENYWTGRNDGVIALFGIAAFLLVLSAGDEKVERLFSGKETLQLLGNASYSIYLTHYLTLSLLGKLVFRLQLQDYLADFVIWVTIFAAATSAGIVFYLWVERPLLSRSRELVNAAKARF